MQEEGVDPYRVAKDMGIFQKLESEYIRTYHDVLVDRIVANKEFLKKKVQKGKKKEETYYG